MAAKTSAGVLLYRLEDGQLQVLLGHMGGPLWARKDDGGWSIPKGEYEEGVEDPFQVALREFQEELGHPVPASRFIELGSARQASGKIVTVWAAEGDFDPSTAVSNTFTMQWPRGSGNVREYPEIDRAAWFDVAAARTKLLKGHVVFLDKLVERLKQSGPL